MRAAEAAVHDFLLASVIPRRRERQLADDALFCVGDDGAASVLESVSQTSSVFFGRNSNSEIQN